MLRQPECTRANGGVKIPSTRTFTRTPAPFGREISTATKEKTQMADIFLSDSINGKDRVKPLVRALKCEGRAQAQGRERGRISQTRRRTAASMVHPINPTDT